MFFFHFLTSQENNVKKRAVARNSPACPRGTYRRSGRCNWYKCKPGRSKRRTRKLVRKGENRNWENHDSEELPRSTLSASNGRIGALLRANWRWRGPRGRSGSCPSNTSLCRHARTASATCRRCSSCSESSRCRDLSQAGTGCSKGSGRSSCWETLHYDTESLKNAVVKAVKMKITVPFVFEDFADAAIVPRHREFAAGRRRTCGANRLYFQAFHAHHFCHSFPA